MCLCVIWKKKYHNGLSEGKYFFVFIHQLFIMGSPWQIVIDISMQQSLNTLWNLHHASVTRLTCPLYLNWQNKANEPSLSCNSHDPYEKRLCYKINFKYLKKERYDQQFTAQTTYRLLFILFTYHKSALSAGYFINLTFFLHNTNLLLGLCTDNLFNHCNPNVSLLLALLFIVDTYILGNKVNCK